MKLFRFDAEVGKVIGQYGSVKAVHTHLLRPNQPVSVGCIYLGAGGVIGYHEAVKNQLFAVVSGNGWVLGADEKRFPITAGQAAFWEGGEFHESGTDVGMMAIVIEGDGLDPAQAMRGVGDEC